jgi:hypothetical protein
MIVVSAFITPQYEFLLAYVRGGVSGGEVAVFSWIAGYTPQDKLTVYTLVTGEMSAMSYASDVFLHGKNVAISEFTPNPLNLRYEVLQMIESKIIISKHLITMANKYETSMPFSEFMKYVEDELNEEYNLIYTSGHFYYSIWWNI